MQLAGDNKLHIGFHSPELPETGSSNGIVTYVGIMRDALRSLGHRVTVVTNSEIENANGGVASLPKLNPWRRRLKMMLERRFDGDGSHAEVRRQVIAAFSAARSEGIQVFEIEETFGLPRRLPGRGVAIVTRLHGPHDFVRKWYEPAEQRTVGDLRVAAEIAGLMKVDAVTAPTSSLLQAIAEKHRLNLQLTRAIPNPIVVEDRTRPRSEEAAASQQILCVGRFDGLKGADVALKAFDLALQQKPTLRLVLVGPDRGLLRPNGRVMYFEEFLAKELSPAARGRITYLGEQRPAQLYELRRASAFALITSRFENFPYSIAEAMAAGLPVLATDTFGAREMIRDRVDGRLVRSGEINEISQAMIEMSSDSVGLIEMGEAARDRVSEWLDPKSIARQTTELYEEAIARSRARSAM